MRRIHLKFLNALTAISFTFIPLTHADELIFTKCLSIKNAKSRLSCYDNAAPEAIAKFAQLLDAKTNKNAEESVTREQQKKSEIDAVALKEQQTLVKDSLKEIKKLNTATKVGVSKIEYSQRVLDVASNVQPNLEEIKNPVVQTQLQNALQAYIDANDYWGHMYNLEYVSAFFERYENEVRKYGITKSVYDDYNGTFRRLGMGQILRPVWTYAEKAIEKAEMEANLK